VNPIVCAAGVDLLMDFLEGVLPPDVNAALVRGIVPGDTAHPP
jgi:hypothetical protein